MPRILMSRTPSLQSRRLYRTSMLSSSFASAHSYSSTSSSPAQSPSSARKSPGPDRAPPSRGSSFYSSLQQDFPLADEDDSWGLFVDCEESEAEMIRHSKILSRRESIRRWGRLPGPVDWHALLLLVYYRMDAPEHKICSIECTDEKVT